MYIWTSRCACSNSICYKGIQAGANEHFVDISIEYPRIRNQTDITQLWINNMRIEVLWYIITLNRTIDVPHNKGNRQHKTLPFVHIGETSGMHVWWVVHNWITVLQQEVSAQWVTHHVGVCVAVVTVSMGHWLHSLWYIGGAVAVYGNVLEYKVVHEQVGVTIPHHQTGILLYLIVLARCAVGRMGTDDNDAAGDYEVDEMEQPSDEHQVGG